MIRDFPEITKDDAIYLAGLIDGEGCITITDSKSTSGKPNYALRLLLGNTHEGIMHWYAEVTSGVLKFRDKSSKGKGANWWEVRLSSNHAAHIIEIIAPYLKIKRAQAEVALEFQRRAKSSGGRGQDITEAQIAERESFKQQLFQIRKDDKQFSLAA